jgi:hypothetical protein
MAGDDATHRICIIEPLWDECVSVWPFVALRGARNTPTADGCDVPRPPHPVPTDVGVMKRCDAMRDSPVDADFDLHECKRNEKMISVCNTFCSIRFDPIERARLVPNQRCDVNDHALDCVGLVMTTRTNQPSNHPRNADAARSSQTEPRPTYHDVFVLL